MNKNIGDMSKEELYDLCNELLDKDTDYMLLQRKIDKTIDLTKNLLKTENKGYYQILFKEILKSLGDKENE